MGKGSIWNVVDVVQEKERDEKASKYFEDFDDAFIEECKAKAPTGDAEAQAGLGLYYLFGIRGEQDPNLGYKWVKKAADQKFAPAEYFVSACYQLGLGVEKDEQKALYWIERSARNGFENAQFTFGLAIENGKVDNNNQQPFEWYKRAAEQGHAEAQNQVGWCYQNGICGAPRSEAEALRWYEKSARQGFHKGQ